MGETLRRRLRTYEGGSLSGHSPTSYFEEIQKEEVW